MGRKSAAMGRVARIKPHYLLHGEKFTVREPVASQLRETKLRTAEKLGCSPRIEQLRQRHSQNKPTICIHRARTYTAAYRETEGEPTVIRRGKPFKRYCEEKPITIQDNELVIGNFACRPGYTTVAPDYSWQWVLGM